MSVGMFHKALAVLFAFALMTVVFGATAHATATYSSFASARVTKTSSTGTHIYTGSSGWAINPTMSTSGDGSADGWALESSGLYGTPLYVRSKSSGEATDGYAETTGGKAGGNFYFEKDPLEEDVDTAVGLRLAYVLEALATETNPADIASAWASIYAEYKVGSSAPVILIDTLVELDYPETGDSIDFLINLPKYVNGGQVSCRVETYGSAYGEPPTPEPPPPEPIPEPTTLLMLCSGLIGLAGYGFRRRNKV